MSNMSSDVSTCLFCLSKEIVSFGFVALTHINIMQKLDMGGNDDFDMDDTNDEEG